MPTSQEIAFFLNAKSDVVQLELFEISHPNFSKVYRFVRNAVDGVTLPNGDVYDYYPAQVTKLTSESGLDYGFNITLGDISDTIQTELANLVGTNALDTEPTLTFRSYRDDNLNLELELVEGLVISQFNFTADASSLEATAPNANGNRTGVTYNFEDFPSLEGFV